MKLREVAKKAAWVVPVALAAAGCSNAVGSEGAPAADSAARVVAGDGAGPARITLSDQAERRLGIETAVIGPGSATSGTGARLVMPYAAVVYDAEGKAWAFASVSARTYQRAPLVIAGIHDDVVTLRSGPAPGTEVVTVGAAELVGAEAGISGEE
jgi:hypothetical protein